MLGNDVVDRDDPVAAGAHLRPRFVARVLAEPERARLAATDDPNQLLWSLFAAKEAAYKALSRHGPLVFAHRRFIVAEDLRSIEYDATTLSLFVTASGACVHAVAWLGDAHPLMKVEKATGDLGLSARRLLCAAVAPRLGCAAEDLSIVRDPLLGSWDGFGPPRLLRAGAPLAVHVSLSHDGRFAACAALGL